MLLPVIGAAAAVIGLSVIIVLGLHVTEPQELAPLPTSDEAMRRYAEAGYFPLMAAASAAGRHALSTAAGLQTFLGLTIIFFSAAYAAWRGFTSSRTRRWSNGFWMAGITAFCLTPSLFRGLTPYMLDYWLTSSAQTGGSLGGAVMDIYGAEGLNSRMLPAAFLTERGLYSAGFAAFLTLLGHDLGYRLREAFEDFGFIEEDEDRLRRRQSRGAGQGAKSGFQRRAEQRQEDTRAEGGFGQRESPRAWSAPSSEEARARAVLGVGAGASKHEIERAYRSQMKRAHPDHGGSVERAAALNAARDLLLGR